ncbi:MAG: hypothetical protein IJH77_06505 [Mogibacterium sp.]|nr:hypothetical protein [Mogibacterium sp.]
MKRFCALALAILLIAAMTACGSRQSEENTSAQEGSGDITEGWELPAEAREAILPEEARNAFEKAFDGFTGSDVVPVAYLGQQVVAGTNYMILCRFTTVTQEPVSSYQIVVIYADLEGNAEILNMSDFEIASFTDGEGAGGQEMLSGGWYVPEDYTTAGLPDEVQSAYDAAMETFTGTVLLTPAAYLGSQLVSGMNYAILCECELGVPDAAKSFAVLTVYQDLEGNAQVTNMYTLDLGALIQE